MDERKRECVTCDGVRDVAATVGEDVSFAMPPLAIKRGMQLTSVCSLPMVVSVMIPDCIGLDGLLTLIAVVEANTASNCDDIATSS